MARIKSKNEKEGFTLLKSIRDVELCLRLGFSEGTVGVEKETERLNGLKAKALARLEEITEKCPGEAHDPDNAGNIDSCMLCIHGPTWGRKYKP